MDIAYFSHQHSFGIKVALEINFASKFKQKNSNKNYIRLVQFLEEFSLDEKKIQHQQFQYCMTKVLLHKK